MKNLNEYLSIYEAGRIKGATKSKPDEKVKWELDPKTDDKAIKQAPIDKTKVSKNTKRLLAKFKAEEDFFVQGRAGWGKTSVIKQMAKRFGYEVIVVYLDKAVATDLEGIPVPTKSKRGTAYQEMAIPGWASLIIDNPDIKFLLFFDEMNQAAPDVQNALMPIVLDHRLGGKQNGVVCDNFFVGAAGNFEDENDAVSELSGPLKSRFKPLIIWESNTPDSWRDSFENYIHPHWDDKLGKNLIDKFEQNAHLFDNPREIEHKLLKFIYKIKDDEDKDLFDNEYFLDRLENLVKSDRTRMEKDETAALADYITEYVQGTLPAEEETGRNSRGGDKSQEMIDPDTIKEIRLALKRGYISNGGKKYGVSKENVIDIVDEDEVNGEMLKRLIKRLENDGLKIKYQTNDEWKKAGYSDPTTA